MNIAVIGTINKDLILPFNGPPVESFGGIFYTISILSHLAGEDHTIYPISFVGEDVHDSLLAILENFPNIDTRGLITIPQLNHKVILEYHSPTERREKALFNFPPLEWEHIRDFLEMDFFIVNMITGWDISLNAFQKLAATRRENIYLDVHFLVMGIDKLGRRFPQRPDNIMEWLKGARFLQMNWREYSIITEGKDGDVIDFFKENLQPDQVLLITLGEAGCKVVFQREQYIRHQDFPPPPLKTVVDTTGCGDAFGAGFVYHFLKTGQIISSVKFGNLVGAANALIPGTTEVFRINELISQLESGAA